MQEPYSSVETNQPQQIISQRQDIHSQPIKKKKTLFVFIILFIVIALSMGVYFFFFYSREAEPEYSEVYRLVPEKISQSAVIRIYLPPSISPEFAKNNIKFSPEIKGDWVAGKSRIGLFARLAEHFKVFAASNGSVEESVIYYNPESDLSLNRYYQVEIAFAEGGSIAEDFLAVENPEISAIFPEKGSEVPEDSDITIVFNRPMVPLTTLGELEKKDVPVVISPATEGRFKWITTRNLQFIPDDRLQRSSNYEVKIKQGLESVDGLELGGETSRFTTRNLRYVGLSGGETVYNRPISIKFNQPVDLNRTENEIVLRNNTTGKEVSFIAEYGGNQEMDLLEDRAVGFFDDGINFFAGANNSFGFLNIFPKKSEQSGTDETIINIYNARDRFGRKKLWDFDNDYTLVIRKAYPSEGDINLEERKTSGFNITGVIKNISAESDKTSWVSKDFFDPQGKLWVEFYEDIDLSRSRIESDKLKNIDYGLKCKDEDLYTSSNVDCEKVADKKRIYLEFNGNEVGLGESLEIDFKKIVNSEGLQINKDPITEYAFSYPEFRISKTLPSSGEQSAVLTELIICSNSPILAPAKEELSEHFKANLDYELNYWGQSYRINYVYASSICGLGEFRTNISYGLMPLSNYSLNLKLEDVFLQKKDLSLDFQTGPMSSEYLTFYQFQDSYVVASPEAKNLTFATRNMEYVSVDICKLSPVNFLYYLNNKPYSSDGLGSMTRCEERVKDSIAIPNKYWIKNYFHFDIADYFSEPLGHYVVTFYHPNYKMTIWSGGSRTETQAFERTYLTVTNLGLAEKKIDPMSSNSSFYDSRKLGASEMEKMNNLYWVTNISTLEPEEGARITLYKDNLVQAGTYYTNQEGIGLADVIYDLKGVVVSKGNDSTVIPSTASRINWASSAFLAKKIYLYTDKPIYRPAQEVFIKGIYRIGYDGDYEIPQGDVTLKVYNSKNDEIFEQELLVSNFGTFNTKLILESNAPLGMCRYCVGDISCSYFDVQEYEPAAFDVQVDTNETEYISKDTANIAVEANYYFGVPLEGGQVSYTISSQNYYFDRYTQEYFNFGSGWNYWSSYYGEKFLLRGETSLSEDGKAQISQVLDFETLFKDEEDRKSKILIIDVTVVNLQGQSISSQKSFIVHAGDFYLGIKPDRWFLSKNENFDLKIKSVDTQGKELKVNNLKLKLYKAKWIYSKRQEVGGGYSYKWEKKKDFIKEYDFVTDKSGNYSQQLSISDEGTYEAIVEGEDKSGNMVRSSQNLYVYGQGSASVRPTTNTELELEAVSTSLNVGDIAEVIIKSPYPDSKALISIERGKIFDYEIVEIKGNLYKYEFLVKEEYLPNVYLSVLVQSPKPEVKFGNINFIIDTARKELDIEVSSNKQHYLPGEEVILDITTKDYQNQPVSAEISLSVVDLSVLALKGNINKNPLVFFYSGFPLTISTASNIKNILVEKEITTKGGGGVTELSSPGMAEDDLARKARGEFRETAFWQAVATTDASGKAQIRFTLPDNLTAWQAETLGVTKDSKLGIDYLEFITRKRLMVVPLKPRFVVPGDEFFIGAKVFNQSGENQNLEVKISSDTLVFEDDIDSGGIKDNETNTYYFKAKAPSNFEEGEHQFILSAKANNLEDTIIQHIEIVPNDTYEVAATANYTNQPVTREYVYLPGGVIQDKGNIKIQSSATLAVFISDALNYLLQFPYAGSEQIASKLNAIAIVKRGLNLPNLADKLNLEKIDFDGKEYTIDEAVELGLSKLYNNQNFDGGFSYWGKGQSNLYLGLDVLESFNNLKLAGYLVNQQASDKLFIYLTEELLGTKGLYKSNDLLILASRIIADTSPDIFNSILRQKIIEFANNTSYLQDKASNYVLANLTILLSKGGFDSQLISKVSQVIDNRIEIDSRGAFLEPSQNRSWSYFENTTKNTAIYLKSLSVRQKEDARLDKVVRWLLNSKYKDGSWGSTKNTLAVIEGFVEFLEWKGETESDFSLDIIVNNESKQEFRFNQDTILEQISQEMALNELGFEKNNIIEFQKENHNDSTNALYYDIALKYYLPIENLGPRDEGFSITRSLHQLDDKENEKPINNAKVGDVLRVHLQITVPKTREFVAIEDFIPAGMEIVNLDLATEQKSLRLQERELEGRELILEYKELYDDRAFLYAGQLRPGVYEFDYFVRALIKGKFAHLPAKISEMYFPENFGRTSGSFFEIK